ncbi:MAG TPA: DNA repair exonuclease [Gemmatimonadaceae bacterium]|jgi:DNA repair exonuclease SbcCD nuclease subunit|nr:DNA repair exonuclease [Gemmatimonadaceae bacterium]
MRLVHLSDLHLGYRQYQRQTPAGINQREADVAGAFARAVEQTIALRPDVVLVAGDVFHAVRPTNPAILHAFAQFARLRAALPDTLVAMVAGNHDTPRSTETGCILRLFRQLGVEVVDGEAQRLSFPERDLSILAVPDVPAGRPRLEPDPAARFNVLLLHGEVEGTLPAWSAPVDRASLEISREELGAGNWSYVALGHYHVYREIAPNAYYAGSIEYTSTNAWGELREEREAGIAGKGFIEHDLLTGRHRFHAVPHSRQLIDLPTFNARGMAAADVDAAIAAAVEQAPRTIDDQIVRLVVRDVPRHIVRELDHKTLRDYKRRALHFQLDTRKPDIVRQQPGQGAPGRRPSLAETVADKLRHRQLTDDIEREALVELGLHYLREADAVAAAPTATVELTDGSLAGDALDARDQGVGAG